MNFSHVYNNVRSHGTRESFDTTAFPAFNWFHNILLYTLNMRITHRVNQTLVFEPQQPREHKARAGLRPGGYIF